MHFLICGDSFSADTKGWPGKLGATITNRSQRGIGEYKIFQQVYEVEQFDNKDIHIHVPEGATPKDGPSAGITMALAVASTLSSIPIKSDIAMTGEITLRGEVLEIGGLKEKLLAALRAEDLSNLALNEEIVKEVIIPKDNEKDLRDLPKNITEKLKIHPVKFVDELFTIALKSKPTRLKPRQKKPLGRKDVSNDITKNLQ